MKELEVAAANSLRHLAGRHGGSPPPGAACANCAAILRGPFCHVCGQNFDAHKRSMIRLVWEATEGLFDLDGRFLRTVPDLFLRPGRLAKDYMEGRIVRHVPPFRTFLLALLVFILAAEQASHRLTQDNARRERIHAAILATPQGRAAEAAQVRREATQELDAELKEAATDLSSDLKDAVENPSRVQARYARQASSIRASYAGELAKADRIAKGAVAQGGADAKAELTGHSRAGSSWFSAGLRKAVANPEFYWTVLFTWAQRAAILFLPIVGLTLALAYRRSRRLFLFDHMVAAMNFLSFVFLANALGLVLPPPLMGYWLGFIAVWTPVNLFQILRGAYGSGRVGATVKTLFVWLATVFTFSCLIGGLLVFSLSQL